MSTYKKVRNTWIKDENCKFTEPAVTLGVVVAAALLALIAVVMIWVLFFLVGMIGMA